MRLRVRTLLLLAPMLTLGACAPSRWEPGPIRNVLLVSIDTLRADHLSCYGAPRNTSPHIDALAAEGVRFRTAVASNPVTLPSHATLLTGTTPLSHGIHDNDGSRLEPGFPTLAGRLAANGFVTGAVVGASVLDASTGVDQGFAHFDDGVSPSIFGPGVFSQRNAGDVAQRAIEFIDAHASERFFLFTHFYDPHFPYRAPEPYHTRFADHPYAGEIAYTDAVLATLFDALRRHGVFDSTLIIVTSDHGEALGEHGEPTHGYFIYQVTQHVPLVIRAPGLGGGREIGGVVGLHDVAPTVLGLLGLPVDESFDGIDLGPLMRGEREPDAARSIYCESYMPTKMGCNPLFGLVTPRWKYIATTRPELYDLGQDPREQTDRMNADPVRRDALAAELEARMARSVEAPLAEPDAERQAQLVALGYLTGPIDPRPLIDPERRDPKDSIDLFIRLTRVKALMHAGMSHEARSTARALLREDPSLVELRRLLGDVAFEEKRWRLAISEYELYLALTRPRDGAVDAGPNRSRGLAHTGIGIAYAKLGDIERALPAFERVLAEDPGLDVARHAAEALRAAGRDEEAAAWLEGDAQRRRAATPPK